MPAISAYAPGKIILFGEHAVVYGRPAIAAPVRQVEARAMVLADPRGAAGQVHLQAPDIHLEAELDQLPADHPLAVAIQLALQALEVPRLPACTVRITSTIPVAAGLGSGAAVSVAILRAVSSFLGHPLSDDQVCALAYEVEKVHHGTPSGIDNSVITYARPVYFIRGQPIQMLDVAYPFTIVIGDSGISCPTAVSVGDVRQAWHADPDHFETLFDQVGSLAQAARRLIEGGSPLELGNLMDQNHVLLNQIGVSSPELDRLVEAARLGGALGAKLSGGGRGGNIIALATPESAPEIARALKQAGAVRTIITEIRL
jgi:mevalonate kinase